MAAEKGSAPRVEASFSFLNFNPLTKKSILSYLLLPFSGLYWIIVFLRNKSFDLGILREESFNVPLISIGNITVGGTGKTPHTEYLVNLLKNEFKVAVLSRGYKRKTKGFILADEFSDAETIGDEPCQIKRKFPEIIVAVDENRRDGIRKILEYSKDIGVVLLDDAFQHRYVKPGLSVLLIDYNRPISDDYLLPFGRLREPASGKKRANMILVTKSPENLKPIERRIIVRNMRLNNLQYLYFTTVKQKGLLPVFKNIETGDVSNLPLLKPSVLLVSGIANPQALLQFASTLSREITEMHFPDHHDFTDMDLSAIRSEFENIPKSEKILITTEKDAVRLQKFSDLPADFKAIMFYIPIAIEFLNDDAENFNIQILNYVRNNKRNSILHSGKNQVPA